METSGLGLFTQQPIIQFAPGKIDLWLVYPLAIQDPSLLNAYRDLVIAEEFERISRFRFNEDQHAALLTRAFIRCLISCYMEGDPGQWKFDTIENGKPVLCNAQRPVIFNISHTNSLIVAAIMPADEGHAVGVDVEVMQQDRSILELASHYFAADEVEELDSHPEATRLARFYEYWTLKESYIKASGKGLSVPLMDFSFSIRDKILPPCGFSPRHISLIRKNDPDEGKTNCHSWLLPAAPNHRIAISQLCRGDAMVADGIRCFEMVPLEGYWHRSLPLT